MKKFWIVGLGFALSAFSILGCEQNEGGHADPGKKGVITGNSGSGSSGSGNPGQPSGQDSFASLPIGTNDPKDPFDGNFSNVNSLQGQWKVYLVKSTRTDHSMTLLKDLVQSKANLYVVVMDGRKTDFALEVQAVADPQCKVTMGFEATYCCARMLRVTLDPKDPKTVTESQPGCAMAHFGLSAADLSTQVVDALVHSTTSSMPQIYHFLYNQSQDHVRLQNPPADDKFTPAQNLETEIFLSK